MKHAANIATTYTTLGSSWIITSFRPPTCSWTRSMRWTTSSHVTITNLIRGKFYPDFLNIQIKVIKHTLHLLYRNPHPILRKKYLNLNQNTISNKKLISTKTQLRLPSTHLCLLLYLELFCLHEYQGKDQCAGFGLLRG